MIAEFYDINFAGSSDICIAATTLSSNTRFDEYLAGIFGTVRSSELKEQLQSLPKDQREPVILKALIEALQENNANYVLPFKFYSVDMIRTSHFIIFVTKNKAGCSIMKSIMYSNSAKDKDDIASFEFHDKSNFGWDCEQLSLFESPFDKLCSDIYNANIGKEVVVGDICSLYELDITNRFVVKNVKDALRKLETENKVKVISGRKQKCRSGILNMPNEARVIFQ